MPTRKPSTPASPTPATSEPPPQSPDALHAWIRTHLDITLARTPLIDSHSAPFDYIAHAFFEGRFARDGDSWTDLCDHRGPTCDSVVWANRGGGKTYLGALATFLELIFKKGIQVRILAGSLEQAGHMYEHLRALFDIAPFSDLIAGKPTARIIKLTNSSSVRILAASERSVRGTRMQKVRCDEVDLFDPAIWRAAQLTTRSKPIDGPWGPTVRGTVEALSTMQNPYGLMWDLVTGGRMDWSGLPADAPGTVSARRLFRWGVVDALEHCPPERPCTTCGLHPECEGRAKLRTPEHAGHMLIDDCLSQKSRVDTETWAAEMLCHRPRRSDSVYPEFEPDLHVVRDPTTDPRLADRRVVRYIGGMDFGWTSEMVELLASVDDTGLILVEREHTATRKTIAEHIAILRSWLDSGFADYPDCTHLGARGLEYIGIDPAGLSRSEQTGKSNAHWLAAAGLPFKARQSEIMRGMQLVRARLAPAVVDTGLAGLIPVTIKGRRALPPATLLIHARCTRLIECLQRYRMRPTPNGLRAPDKSEGFDHACDALRYMITNHDLHDDSFKQGNYLTGPVELA